MEPTIVKVIGSLISWTFFVIVLAMIKNFISHGFSMAIAEFLLNSCTKDQREKYVRWFGNGDVILEHLNELDKKVSEKK